MSVFFAPFRLDFTSEQMWREEQAIALRPKTFAVLRYLNRTTRHSYTQAASCEISSCAVSAARSAWTTAVTSGV